MLLTEKNLKTVLEHPKSFVILVFLQLVLPTLMIGKNFVLKDLSFYKFARLDAHESKCQEGNLHQALTSSSLSTLSFALRLAKMHNAPRLSARSQAQVSVVVLDETPEVERVEQSEAFEQIVHAIFVEVNENEEMVANLRVSFGKKHKKRLTEVTEVGQFLTKKLKTSAKNCSSFKLVPTHPRFQPPHLCLHLRR